MTRVLCAWHPKYFPSEAVPLLREVADGTDNTSHGVCPACRSYLKKPGGRKAVNKSRRDFFSAPVFNAGTTHQRHPTARPPLDPAAILRSRREPLPKNLIGKFIVKLIDGERREITVHRRGHAIMLNDHTAQTGNQFSELGWRREVQMLVPNIVDLEFVPANPFRYGLGFMPGLDPVSLSPD